MKLNNEQNQYRIDGKILLGNVNDSRWNLAYHAMRGKQNKIESWAAILADLARVEERTVREWAQAAEFREEIDRVHGKYIDLPYSFYARASHKVDAIDFEIIVGLMTHFESNPDAKISEFEKQLNALAGPELPDYGGFPPSGYPLADAIRDELSRLNDLAERPGIPSAVVALLWTARAAIEKALTLFAGEVSA